MQVETNSAAKEDDRIMQSSRDGVTKQDSGYGQLLNVSCEYMCDLLYFVYFLV